MESEASGGGWLAIATLVGATVPVQFRGIEAAFSRWYQPLLYTRRTGGISLALLEISLGTNSVRVTS